MWSTWTSDCLRCRIYGHLAWRLVGKVVARGIMMVTADNTSDCLDNDAPLQLNPVFCWTTSPPRSDWT